MNSLSRFDAPVSRVTQSPRIYYVHPLQLNGLDAWRETFRHASSLGFNTVLTAPIFKRGKQTSVFVSSDFDRVDPALGLGEDVAAVSRALSDAAAEHNISLMLDLVIDRVAASDREGAHITSDPRIAPDESCSLALDLSPSDQTYRHLEEWRARLARLIKNGVAGFRCLGINRVPAEVWKSLIGHSRAERSGPQFIAWTPGTDFGSRRALQGAGFDGSFSSLAWWNLEDSWLPEEHLIQRSLGYQVAFPEAPFGKRLAHGTESCEVLERRALRALKLSAYLVGGLMIPMGFEFGASMPLDQMSGDGLGLAGLRDQSAFDISSEIRATNEQLHQSDEDFDRRPFTLIAGSNSSTVAILQSDREDLRVSQKVRAILVNRDLRQSAATPLNAIQQVASAFLPLTANDGASAPRLKPG